MFLNITLLLWICLAAQNYNELPVVKRNNTGAQPEGLDMTL